MTSATATLTTPAILVARVTRWSRWLVAAVVGVSVAASLLPAGAHDLFVLVLVLAGLLAGLPHGAVDHRLAADLTGRPTVVVAAGYAAVAALTWALITTAGLVALVPVLVLSLVHFALGEREVMRTTTGWRPSRPVSWAAAVAGTGALLLPLARADASMGAVATSISPHLGALVTAGPSRFALVAVWVLAASVALVPAVRDRRWGVVADIVLVGALGALAPPLVAFAVWFGGWHALRHCARLLTVDRASAALLARGQTRGAVGALVRAAAWPTLAAVAVLATAVVATVRSTDPAATVGATLLVLLALTVPHVLVVMVMDQR